jgi:hypothetical protein
VKRLGLGFDRGRTNPFLDNVNGTMLRSNVVASVLTERPVRIRSLGRPPHDTLNSTACLARF